MSASRNPSGASVEVAETETGHFTVTRMAVVPALAAAKFTLNVFESGLWVAVVTGVPLSSRIWLLGATPLTVPFESTEAVS